MTPSRPRRPSGGPVNVALPGMPDLPVGADPDEPAARTQMPTDSVSGGPLPQVKETTQSFRESLFGVLTGRQVEGAGGGDVRAQLIAAFGSSGRDPSRPDTAAAAKGLGVSQRSVQRWLKKGGGLSTGHNEVLQRRARQVMTTKRGRQRAIAASQRTGKTSRPVGKSGKGLRVGGVQGIVTETEDDYRDRETSVMVTDEDLDALREVWAEHGDAGAAAWIHSHWDEHYVGKWHFQSIDDVSWSDTRNY